MHIPLADLVGVMSTVLGEADVKHARLTIVGAQKGKHGMKSEALLPLGLVVQEIADRVEIEHTVEVQPMSHRTKAAMTKALRTRGRQQQLRRGDERAALPAGSS